MKIASKWIAAVLAVLLLPVLAWAGSPRVTKDFDANWLFTRGDFATAMMSQFDDHGWQHVNVPHDWSSYGPFSPKYASGTGYAPGGIGWYRKHFHLSTNDEGRIITIQFDGVYDNSEVWINGQFVGRRPYGFSSFAYNLTPYVNYGTKDNVVAVRVDHSRYADSRYYTGSGIYRNVRLVIRHKLRVAHWGVYVTTPKVSRASATVRVATTVKNGYAAKKTFTLESIIITPDGKIVGSAKTVGATTGNGARKIVQQVKISHPALWSPDSPALYKLQTRVITSSTVADQIVTPFGVRHAVFNADTGFSLNGRTLKLKGVCLHHDAGPLGAAVPEQVLARRLRILKSIGVNAIRTSHNPPDPVLLNLCDRLGFLVMDEAFDEFTPGKKKWVKGVNRGIPSHYGYCEYFAKWGVTDIRDMVRRDRNHPCVILWSIGNEIDYANDPFSNPVLGKNYRPHNPPAKDLIQLAKPLIAAVKSEDRTRPVTAALANIAMSDAVGLPQLLDVVGYNYQEWRYAKDHRKFPHRIMFGSETSHRYGAWQAVRTNNFISGQFLWIGADYLGEAGKWPNRANGAGLLDLCSFKKPIAWFRQSLWSDRPMVYLCVARHNRWHRFAMVQSWNWRTNTMVRVLCFANCPEVTLKLNGKTIGTKTSSEARRGVLSWQIPYEPGRLEAIGRSHGKELCHYTLRTAGAPARIELLPDHTQLRADDKDVSQIEFRIVDANGVRVPNAMPEVHFDLTGPARILGIGNGNRNSDESCHTNRHQAFHGRGLFFLQTTPTAGRITLTATAHGLAPATVTLQSR